MKKMQEKNKLYIYTSQKHQPPLKPSHMDGKYQSPPPPQISKSRRIKWFGENVG
jgi:hypothetical protein